MIKLTLGILTLLGFSSHSLATNLVEREGRYEINWSTGKVRFYGVGQIAAGDDSFRAAEQRAWADGLKAAESHIPKVLSNKLGAVDKLSVEKLSKLSTATVSVSTTYFGDNRVKVLLEAPIQKITPQLVNSSAGGNSAASSNQAGVVIKLPKGAKPSVFVKVLDEHGREMVSTKEMVAGAHAGAPLARWFKTNADLGNGGPTADSPVISGTSPEAGVVRIQSSDWKPAYASAFTAGSAAFVVQ
jgi:hypothetical protein